MSSILKRPLLERYLELADQEGEGEGDKKYSL